MRRPDFLQRQRLRQGRCPVHGAVLYERGLVSQVRPELPGVFFVGCPRDCAITATEKTPFGPATLTPECAGVMDASVTL